MTNLYWNGLPIELLKGEALPEGAGYRFTYRVHGDGPEVERTVTRATLLDLFAWTLGEEPYPEPEPGDPVE